MCAFVQRELRLSVVESFLILKIPELVSILNFDKNARGGLVAKTKITGVSCGSWDLSLVHSMRFLGPKIWRFSDFELHECAKGGDSVQDGGFDEGLRCDGRLILQNRGVGIKDPAKRMAEKEICKSRCESSHL